MKLAQQELDRLTVVVSHARPVMEVWCGVVWWLCGKAWYGMVIDSVVWCICSMMLYGVDRLTVITSHA